MIPTSHFRDMHSARKLVLTFSWFSVIVNLVA
jgi:hypothetical protein